MVGLDGFGGIEVGDGAGDLQGAVVGASTGNDEIEGPAPQIDRARIYSKIHWPLFRQQVSRPTMQHDYGDSAMAECGGV